MTVLCALHEPSVGTWIASDRLETRGWGRRLLPGGKWVLGSHWAAGISGNAVLLDVIREHEDWLSADMSARDFAKALVEHRRDSGWAPVKSDPDDGGPPRYDGRFILASAKEIWEIDAAAHCHRSVAAFAGGGDDGAQGAWFACQAIGVPASRAIRIAIEAAIDQHAGCGGEPWVHLLK